MFHEIVNCPGSISTFSKSVLAFGKQVMQFHEVRKLISKDFFYNFRYDSGELVCPDGLYNAIGPSKCSPKFELILDSLSESDFVIIIRWVWMVTLVVFGFFRIPSKVCHYWSYILSTPTLSAFFYDFSNNHFTWFSKRSKSVWVQWLAIHPEIDFDMPIRETDYFCNSNLYHIAIELIGLFM